MLRKSSIVFLSLIILFIGCKSNQDQGSVKRKNKFQGFTLNEKQKTDANNILNKLSDLTNDNAESFRKRVLNELNDDKVDKDDKVKSKIKDNLNTVLKKKDFNEKDKKNIISLLDEYKKYMASGDKTYLKIKYDNNLGYINAFGTIIIPPELDGSEIGDYNDNFVWVKERPKYFIMDENLKIIRDSDSLNYDSLSSFTEDSAVVSKQGKYGYIDSLGKLIIPPIYEDALSFSNGVAFIKEDNLWGLINKNGTFVVKPIFDYAFGGIEGYFQVKKDNLYGVINNKGEYIVDIKYDWTTIVYNTDYIILSLNGKSGCINRKTKKMVFDFKYDSISYSRESQRFIIKKDGLYYLSDVNGKYLCEGYDSISQSSIFSDYFEIEKNYEYGIIDSNNTVILKPDKYYYYRVISKDKKQIAVRKYKEDFCNIIDFSGKEIRKTRYSFIYEFSEGRAKVQSDKKYGLVNEDFSEVTPLIYDQISKCQNNIYRVSNDQLYGCIDNNGKSIIDIKYTSLYEEGNYIKVYNGDLCGLTDTKGNIVLPLEYSNLFFDGAGNRLVGKAPESCYFYDVKKQKVLDEKYQDVRDFEKGFIVQKDKKQGTLGFDLKEVIPFTYEKIDYYKDDLYFAKKDNNTGIIDKDNKVILELKYQEINLLPENETSLGESYTLFYSGNRWKSNTKIISVKQNDKYGFMNTLHKVIIKPSYDEILQFSDNSIRVRIGDKWGIVDANSGKILLEPKYNYIGDIYDGIAICYNDIPENEETFKDKNYYAINETGVLIKDFEYKFDVSTMVNGFATARTLEGAGEDETTGGLIYYHSIGVIDSDGKTIFSISDNMSGKEYRYGKVPFYGGVNVSSDSNRWGVMDFNGKYLLEPLYDKLVIFDYTNQKLNEHAYIVQNGKFGMVDKEYKILIDCKYDELMEFTPILCKGIREGKCYLIEKNSGKEIAGPFKDITYGDDLVKMIGENNLYGFITREGKIVINSKYNDVTTFTRSISGAKVNNKWGVIDIADTMIVKPEFDSVFIFDDGIIQYNIKNKTGYINILGLKIFEIWEASN